MAKTWLGRVLRHLQVFLGFVPRRQRAKGIGVSLAWFVGSLLLQRRDSLTPVQAHGTMCLTTALKGVCPCLPGIRCTTAPRLVEIF
jgi:hypothetical protein